MTHDDKIRKQNKHMKIVLCKNTGSSDYRVLQTTGTLSPRVGTCLGEREAQEFINEGYTVTIKRSER